MTLTSIIHQIVGVLGCSLEALSLVSDAAQLVVTIDSPAELGGVKKQQCQALASSLVHLRQEAPDPTESTMSSTKIQDIAELYRLSALIYLYRATGEPSDQLFDFEGVVKRALCLLSSLETCERAFPLFIVGCEAHLDDQRCQVLDLISRTQRHCYLGNVALSQEIIERVWAQKDLEAMSNYAQTLTKIIRSCNFCPSFS